MVILPSDSKNGIAKAPIFAKVGAFISSLFKSLYKLNPIVTKVTPANVIKIRMMSTQIIRSPVMRKDIMIVIKGVQF